METVTASEMKNRLGGVFESALVNPVHISRRGTQGYVLLSADEYERLQSSDDAYWSSVARSSRKKGEYLSPKTSLKEIEKRLA